jgi:hypothetical protein
MTDRFPRPWRIVEIPRGFAVEDATGLQLCVFYGRSDPNTAGHTGFLTIDEARQMALDFAKLPELVEQMSARREVAKAVFQQTPQPFKLVRNERYSSPERLPGNRALLSEIPKPR